jgi:hypothetical protein
MGMRRALIAVVAIGIIGASCTASRVDPKATIAIDGTVLRQGGAPVAGARVALQREGDVGDVFATITSFGVACLNGKDAPANCHNARITSTSSRGAFGYTVKGSETQSTFGFSAVLNLTTQLEAKPDEVEGSSTTYRFHVQTTTLDLPLRLWEPTLDARTGSFGARVSFPRFPADLLPRAVRAAPRYTIDFASGKDIVWELAGSPSATTFDPRLLEDSTGTMSAIASASNIHASEQLGDEVAYALRSGSRAYESPVGPPTSRGKSCSVVDEHGKNHVLSPCGLTDGAFRQTLSPNLCAGATGCTEPNLAAAIVDLGSVVPADLIVLRGCDNGCRVETSTDGRKWIAIGATQETDAAFAVAPRAARYVRVQTSFVGQLTELSVWARRPRLPNASFLINPAQLATTGRTPAPAARSTSSHRFLWFVVIAALLLGGVAGAAAMLVARDRKRGAF